MAIALGLSSLQPLEARATSSVEMDVHHTPLTPAVAEQTRSETAGARTQRQAAKRPARQIFGLNPSAVTDGESEVALPIGNTVMIDPEVTEEGPIEPLPIRSETPAKPKPTVAERELRVATHVFIQADLCGREVKYPFEAEQLGIEGDVVLKIGYDQRGQITHIQVLSGLGHGLDQAAIDAMKNDPGCRATPALGTDGKSIADEIKHTFHFVIPR